jgi:hypothetical protein
LPLRAAKSPAVNFGDPETWSRIWSVVTRKEFGALSLHPAAVPFRNVALVLEQLRAFWMRGVHQGGVGGLILAGMGICAGLVSKEHRWKVAGGLFLWAVGGALFEIFSNLSPSSDIGQWRLERFFLIPLAGTTLILASLVHQIFSARGIARGLLVAVVIGLFGQTAWSSIRPPNYRWNLVFRDFALATLRCAPEKSRLVIDRVMFDEPTSSLLVATQVEGKRPDVKFFYRPGTLFQPVYGKDVLDLSWDGRFVRQDAVEKKEFADTSRPVRYLGFEKSNAPFAHPVLDGLVYRDAIAAVDGPPHPALSPHKQRGGRGDAPPSSPHAIPGGRGDAPPSSPQTKPGGRGDAAFGVRGDAPFSVPRGRGEDVVFPSPSMSSMGGEGRVRGATEPFFCSARGLSPPDYPSRLIAAHLAYFAGKAALEKNDMTQAQRWFSYLLQKNPDMAWLASNVGALYAKKEMFEEARRCYAEAVNLDPYFSDGHYGLGYVSLKLGNFSRGIEEYTAAIRTAPEKPAGYYMLGVAYSLADRSQEAIEPWRKFLELSPEGKMADDIRAELKKVGG